MKMTNDKWSYEETLIAFNVYCKIPFKKCNKNHPMIIKYAKILNRTPSALNMKVGNFGRLDPELKNRGIVGLKHGSKLEKIVWDEFNNNWNELVYKTELIISTRSNNSIENFNENPDFPPGKERIATIKKRINQSFFRATVLSSYNEQCCITGIPIPTLLVASHIKPWSIDIINRINPRNGLCLNAFHDKAFDAGYITITPDYIAKISDEINQYANQPSIKHLLLKYNNKKIALPDRFTPEKLFLDYHHTQIFRK